MLRPTHAVLACVIFTAACTSEEQTPYRFDDGSGLGEPSESYIPALEDEGSTEGGASQNAGDDPGDEGGDDVPDDEDVETPCDFSATNSCTGPEIAATLSADEGDDVDIITGETNGFVQVRVEETAIFVGTLSLGARFWAPEGMEYRVFVYAGKTAAPDCTQDPLAILQRGDDTFTASWHDLFPAYDDGYYFTFEVEYESGELCGPDAAWELELMGNVLEGGAPLPSCGSLELCGETSSSSN